MSNWIKESSSAGELQAQPIKHSIAIRWRETPEIADLSSPGEGLAFRYDHETTMRGLDLGRQCVQSKVRRWMK